MFHYVLDHPFNRENYPGLIGDTFPNPPAYAAVIPSPLHFSEIKRDERNAGIDSACRVIYAINALRDGVVDFLEGLEIPERKLSAFCNRL